MSNLKFFLLNFLFIATMSFLPAEDLWIHWQDINDNAERSLTEAEWRSLWKDSDGRQVFVRGFCYQTPEYEWILSTQPDLKTCCIGTPKGVRREIFLEFPSETLLNSLNVQGAGQVVQVMGTFHIKPEYNDRGELAKLYVLSHPRLVELPRRNWTPWVATTLILLVVALGLHFYNKANSA